MFLGHSVRLGAVSCHAPQLAPAGREEERGLFTGASC